MTAVMTALSSGLFCAGILQLVQWLTPLGDGTWEAMPAALGAEFDSAESIIDHVESSFNETSLHLTFNNNTGRVSLCGSKKVSGLSKRSDDAGYC